MEDAALDGGEYFVGIVGGADADISAGRLLHSEGGCGRWLASGDYVLCEPAQC